MRNTLRYSFATVMTAGLVVSPVTAAFADTSTDGSGGIGSGNQVVVPVDVEADLCGNSIAVLGISKATCTQVSEVLYEASGKGDATTTDGSGGVASGNQIIVPVDAALDACGNATAVGGISEAECVEVVEALEEESADAPRTTTDGSGGVASGNQIIVPVDAAINVCGNSVAILGAASSKCTTIINIIQASPENEGGASTDGSGGVGSGNQVVVPVDAAVDICGNAVSVLGLAEASCLEVISEEKPEEPEGEKPEEPEEPEGEKPEEPEGEKPEEPEEPEGGKPEEDDSSTEDDKPSSEPQADEQLAVTGGALTGLVAAGIAAVGAGGAGLYFARKRKAAATVGDEE